MRTNGKSISFWENIRSQFAQKPLGVAGLVIVAIFSFVGIYAPFFASSKPFWVYYDGEWYFPFFRYLFYRGFYTKRLDLFYNLLMFTLPPLLLSIPFIKGNKRKIVPLVFLAVQTLLFLWVAFRTPQDPAWDKALVQERLQSVGKSSLPSWKFDLSYMNGYAKINLLVREKLRREQHAKLRKYIHSSTPLPTLWFLRQESQRKKIERQKSLLNGNGEDLLAVSRLSYLEERRDWIQDEIPKLQYMVMPFIRHYHWEDDAGGDSSLNQQVAWLDLTRTNRKDLAAALIFGTRISLTVGIMAVALALAIGIPVGSFAGYYGGNWDILVSRMMEVWEAMPTFFMLLMVVAITQSKSIFLVIGVIGIFGWTGISRFIRGEFFKQRNLSYVEACHALGFRDSHIMFSHILPNAIPPVLTLLPFSIMAAITSEAGLSFLGLGEEGSCSWGVLMDEGRMAFPGESYLLWPPAILLTVLLIGIALVGDAMRDAFDPKMRID